MDIWEANSMDEAYTLHPCVKNGQYTCKGLDCGAGNDRYKGVCDKDGCDLNPFRVNNRDFLGKGSNFSVDTTQTFKVVT